MIVHVGPGGIDRVEGDPEHPASRGYLCSKAHVAKEIVESPHRLTTPLRKTPAGFAPIGWDDALDLAAEKLTAIRDKYGPASLVRNAGAPVSYDARDGFVHFMQVFGSSNFTGSANCCWLPRATAFGAVMGGKPEPDFESARLIVFWGANPVATERYGNYCSYPGFNRIISRAKARGARLIAIDPMRSETVARVDEWIRIRPGTDIALGLAMIHVIVGEGLYDEAFVSHHTTGFDDLKAHVRDNDPGWAAGITGLDPDTIVDLARSLATTKPATICDGNGFDMYCNVVDAVRTVAILLGLTGNVDVPGGVVFLPFAKQSVLAAPKKSEQIWRDRFPLFRDVPFPGIKEAILGDEEDRPRALISHHSNPVLIQANQDRTRSAFEKLDFVMVDDIFMTATAEAADLVLPATSSLERWGYRAYSSFDRGYLALSRPVADPVGESRDVFRMEHDLAQRMGLGADYPFSDSRSWVAHMLAPSGVTLEQLEREQIVNVTDEPRYRKYEKAGFQTPSGKLEFRSQQFEKAGYDPLPVYGDATSGALDVVAAAGRSFPLRCTSRRPGQFVHTRFRNLRTTTESYPEPLLRIRPDDAAARDLADGDLAEMSSPQGRVAVRARFDRDLDAGLVVMDFGWGNPSDGLASSNLLTSDEVWNPVSGSTPQRLFACDVVKKEA
jgi:anaerobic selenocysteine-containing dehydrogenase